MGMGKIRQEKVVLKRVKMAVKIGMDWVR